MKYRFFLTTVIILCSLMVFAQDDHSDHNHKHEENKEQATQPVEIISSEIPVHESEKETVLFSNNPNPGWDEFPSMHPMVVHFPIVLLLLAFFSQIGSFLFWKQELSLITLVLLLGGTIGAFVASNFTHPHTTELNEVAAQLLNQHENYAGYTKWISLMAVLLKAGSHFYFDRKVWIEIVVVILLAGAAFCVSQAGHYGAALTHLHGIGVKGEFLENASHSH